MDRAVMCVARPLGCHESGAPTLSSLDKHVAMAWIEQQIILLTEYAGAQNKMNNFQIRTCASIILAKHYHLNLDEMLTFFGEFMASGKFYGSVDPMVITKALDEYEEMRRTRLDIIESQKAEKERERRIKEEELTACTPEEAERILGKKLTFAKEYYDSVKQ